MFIVKAIYPPHIYKLLHNFSMVPFSKAVAICPSQNLSPLIIKVRYERVSSKDNSSISLI